MEEVVTFLGSRSAAAAALGVAPQHVARVLSGERDLGIVAIVRAATLTGRDVARAVRDVGEEDAAELLTRGFGGASVSRAQRKILDQIDALPPSVRRHVLGLIAEWPVD